MCSLCAALGGSRGWTDAAGRDAFRFHGKILTVGQERERRVALVARVLAPYGLSIRDWGRQSYVLADRDGCTANVFDLAGVWSDADRLSGEMCDPLDDRVLQALGVESADSDA